MLSHLVRKICVFLAIALGSGLLSAGCIIPPFVIPHSDTHRMKPGELTLVEAGTHKHVDEALVLAIKVHMPHSMNPQRRLTNAVVFN